MADRSNRDGVAILVALKSAATAKAMRVNVTLPKDILAQMDHYAESRGLTRSGFLALAAKQAMGASAGRVKIKTMTKKLRGRENGIKKNGTRSVRKGFRPQKGCPKAT